LGLDAEHRQVVATGQARLGELNPCFQVEKPGLAFWLFAEVLKIQDFR